MTREEIEQKMVELVRRYVETRNRKIIDELYELPGELEKRKRWKSSDEPS
jgi:hypothetical protein